MKHSAEQHKTTPYTTRSLLEACMRDDISMVKATEHFEYSSVFFTEYPSVDLFLLSSEAPIDFADMPKYFSQIEAIDAVASEYGLTQTDDSSPMWLYHNETHQPLDPSGNPVRSPFRFEIGYRVEPPSKPVEKPSSEAGVFLVKRLPPLSVASIIYKGSFPHQENSGFVEACQTLIPALEAAGLTCAYTLYREIYHYSDWDDPSQSITEVQLRLSAPDTVEP